ncbi:MAG: hypothetical protein H6623_01965 [Bdellovibrionaceae bacterium]|nr:hypothetical protein [Pseudobdellovibrionaceae bacterium]
MKNISFAEFDELVSHAQNFLGAQVEGIILDENICIITLKHATGTCALIIDVRSQVPFFTITDKKTPRFKKETKPLVLFLKAHLIGLHLKSVQRIKEYGRLIEFRFTNHNKNLTLEAHLFPQGKNIIAKTPDAMICLKKPQDLARVTDQHPSTQTRSAPELYQEWLTQWQKPNTKPKDVGNSESSLLKQQKTLKKLEQQEVKLLNSQWRSFAQWLNRERCEDVPTEYAELYDPKQTIVENIERAFAEAKKTETKLQALQERIQHIQSEMSQEKPHQEQNKKTPEPANPLEGAKGRTREFAQHNIRAYIGKSGKDNLKLLRQSKPWYIWIHAKDWPSAHAIIAINKNQKLPQDVLKDVCLWILKETLSTKQWQSWIGIKVDFLFSERRYVQPIKGDHHGLVRYSQAQTATFTVQ